RRLAPASSRRARAPPSTGRSRSASRPLRVHARTSGGRAPPGLPGGTRSPVRAAVRAAAGSGGGSAKPEVSAVLVAWNAGSSLATCTSSLRKAAARAGVALQVVVVDNASDDGSVDQLAPQDGDRGVA